MSDPQSTDTSASTSAAPQNVRNTPNEGILEAVSVPQLLAEAWRDRRSGTLRVAQGKSERQIIVLEGAPVSVEVNPGDDHFAQSLQDAGKLTGPERLNVEKLAQERSCPQATAVLALRLVDAKTLYLAIRKEARNQIAAAFEWTQGGYQWLPVDASASESAKPFDVLGLIQTQLPKRWGTERLFQSVMNVADCHGDIAPRFRRVVRQLSETAPEVERAIARLDGSAALGQILGESAGDPVTAATLWLLVHTGILRLVDAQEKNALTMALEFEVEVTEAPKTAEANAGSATGVDAANAAQASTNPKADALRTEIEELLPQVGDLDHYSALGLTSDVKAVEIKKAYFKAAKRYHPDALAKMGLDDLKAEAATVFARIAEAFETLSDPAKRERYDQGGSEEPDIDMARLAQAETSYRKGEILLRMGNFAAALEYLEPAVELWPEEAAYQAALGWALFKQPKRDKVRAREHLELAHASGPEDAATMHRLSIVLRQHGEKQKAEEFLARAQQLDPELN
ncbi:MAG: DnaJ domain-containing protein [Myxococcota bacterium]